MDSTVSSAGRGGEPPGLLGPDYLALEAVHGVELRLEDGLVLAGADGRGNRDVGPLEGLEDPVLTEDVVGRVGSLVRRRATEDEVAVARAP